MANARHNLESLISHFMPRLKFFNEINKHSVAEAGGKGASLGEMMKAGIPVPPGFVVLANAFDRFLEETKLKEEIIARLNDVNHEDINSVENASNVIRSLIDRATMPTDLETDIEKAFDKLDAKYVAVRSSATAEDSSTASWAGELETYLNTEKETVIGRVKQCWSSLFTPRAIFYRFEKKLRDQHISVAVVIQKMIQSEISGIAFTVHPVTEDYDQMIIEAGYGLGEAIVSGQITPDSFVVSKKEMKIIDISVGNQSRKLVRALKHENIETLKHKNIKALKQEDNNEDSANDWIELTEDESKKQKLNEGQIIELAKLCEKIESHYGFPCDIEWASEGGEFFITQSRPITTLKPVPGGKG